MDQVIAKEIKKRNSGKILRTLVILTLGIGVPLLICYVVFKFLIPMSIIYNDAYKDFVSFIQKVITIIVVALTYYYVSKEMEKIVTLIPSRLGDTFSIDADRKRITIRMKLNSAKKRIITTLDNTFLVEMD